MQNPGQFSTQNNNLGSLVASGRIEIVQLGDTGMHFFEGLIVGPSNQTLDDGEAATIAYALESDAIALIDERKATRICEERFARLQIGGTIDIFAHSEMQIACGNEKLGDAVFRSLLVGKTRVPAHQLQWVVNLIGLERARQCTSLPSAARGEWTPPLATENEEV
jgi:predicted nucleic acid-binding protein